MVDTVHMPARDECAKVLSGWKEIAAYMGRGVRTVQRWEKLGLPVRRPSAHLRSAVVANVEDLSVWINGCTGARASGTAPNASPDQLRVEVEVLRLENQALRREVDALKLSTRQMQPSASAPSAVSSQQAA